VRRAAGRGRRLVILWLVAAAAAALVIAARADAATRQAARPSVAEAPGLPLHETVAAAPGDAFAVLITGDGGWAAADRALAASLAARGIPVVALDARAYLSAPRTVGGMSADLARLLASYGERWRRPRAIVVGYSRGADLAPFMVSRLPEPARRRVALVALLGPSASVGLRFHWVDLVADVRRSGDLPVPPEVAKLRGTPVLCIYGTRDGDAICPRLDPALARPLRREGSGHRVTADEAERLAAWIAGAAGT
jgi:type IV secretory pathway VirJ component